MKHSIIALFLILLASGQNYGQDYTPTWGPVYKKEGGIFSTFNLIGIEGEHYYLLMRPKKGNTLLKYNMEHKLVGSKNMDLKHGKDNIVLESIIKTKNGIFGYMNTEDKKNNEWKMYISKFNSGSFSSVRETYSHSFKGDAGFNFRNSRNRINKDLSNELAISNDSSKVAFTNVLSFKEKKSKEQIAVAVFDADMNLVWDRIHEFQYQDDIIEFEQTLVSNDGTLYILAKVTDETRYKDKSGLPYFDYKIFKLTKDNTQEVNVEIGDGIAPTHAKLFLQMQSNTKFVLTGFYTNAERKCGLMGIFYISGDLMEGDRNVKIHKFDPEFLEGITRKKNIENDRGLSLDFRVDDYVRFNDGSLSIIAEEYIKTVLTHRDLNGNTSYSSNYTSNAILIPRFTAEGDLVNIQKIEKSHLSIGTDMYASYAHAYSGNKIYFIFNDEKSKEERKKMKGNKKGEFTDLVVINENNEIEFRETIFSSKDIDLNFVPSLSDFTAKRFLIGSQNDGGGKYAFGIIELK